MERIQGGRNRGCRSVLIYLNQPLRGISGFEHLRNAPVMYALVMTRESDLHVVFGPNVSYNPEHSSSHLLLLVESLLMLYRLVPAESVSAPTPEGWLLQLPTTVGRGHEQPVCIDDDSISRAHCQLMLGPDEALQVRDLGSLNGTYVNGERIRGIHSLIPGDTLQLGAVSLRVEYASDTDPGPAPAKPKRPSMNATQPMKQLTTPKFTMHEMKEEPKRWWEFWKE